jgi:DNA-binding CsgD family transcriptional regulator
LGARFALLVFQDGASALLELKHSSGANKDWVCEYLRAHRRLDAASRRALEAASVGAALFSSDFLAPAQFKRSAAFQRWLAPHGLVDVAGAVLRRSMRGACLLIACFAYEMDDRSKARLGALASTLAGEFAELSTPQSGRGALLNTLFDALAAPIIVIDESLHVQFTNSAARRALARDDGLGVVEGALVIEDRDARAALREIVAGHAAGHDSAVMLRHGEAQCCVMHVVALAGDAFALFLRRLGPEPRSGDTVAAGIYGLTGRERSVLLAIAEVGGVPATAKALKLSEGTVKSYLKTIFQKTGARRQADLVKLALLLESPFLSEERATLLTEADA